MISQIVPTARKHNSTARICTFQRGAVIVEAAFALVLLIPLLMGIMEFSRVWGIYQTLTNAAREGGRFGAAPCPLLLTIQPLCTAGMRPRAPQIRALTERFLSIAGRTNATVTVDTEFSRNISGNDYLFTRVQVSVPYTFQYFNYTVTIEADSVMRNEDN